MRITQFLLAILFSVSLASCGGGSGGGGGGGAGNSSTISGSVVKGPVTGATVTFFKLNDDGSKGAKLGSSTTDADGYFTVTLKPEPTTPFLGESSGGSYIDEATGLVVSLSASDKLSVVIFPGTLIANITPLTHMAATRAMALAASGTPLSTAISSSNIGIATQYGVEKMIGNLPPAANNADSVAASTRGERIYALVLAGLSQQASNLGVRAIDLASALAEDAKDGVFDGKNGSATININTLGGSSISLPATAGTTDMQAAINAFIASPDNMTGITEVNIPLTAVPLGVNTAGTLYTSLPVLPAAESFQSYSTELTASGGTPPYTCALKAGSVLPAGFNIVPGTCQITGVASYTTSVSAPFTITLTDSSIPPSSVDFVDLRITTVEPGPTLIPVDGSLTKNISGSTQVATATGGTPPYHFSHDSFAYGAHPLGTSLDMGGYLFGTASQTGTYNFKVCVVDLVGAQDCEMTSVTVNPETTAGPLTGTWIGTWEWSGPGSNGCQFSDGGSFSMTLIQDGTSFSGSTSGEGIQWRDNSTCTLVSTESGTGTISGSISGTNLNLDFDLSGVSFSGTAVLNNNTLTASIIRTTGGSGSITVTRQ